MTMIKEWNISINASKISNNSSEYLISQPLVLDLCLKSKLLLLKFDCYSIVIVIIVTALWPPLKLLLFVCEVGQTATRFIVLF